MFFVFVLLPYALLFLVLLYVVKMMLGIDIFPDIHIPHLIRDFLSTLIPVKNETG